MRIITTAIKIAAVMITVAVSGAADAAVPPSPFPSSGQFDQVTSITAPKLSLKFTQSVMFKGPLIRVDKTDLSQVIPITQIETPDTMYFYSSVSGTGEKTAISQKLPPLLERMDSDTKSKLKGAAKVGAEKFEGYNCDIYKTSSTNGNEEIKFWVSTDPSFPFTLKTVATDRLLDKVTTVDLENIELNPKLGDSLFQVPQSIKISSMNSQSQSPTTSPSSTPAPASSDAKP